MSADLAVAALRMAHQRRRPVGTTVHSDRGSQFRSRRFVHALSSAGLVGSMGRVGAAGDNAAMESFFTLLQKNILDQRWWASRQELRLEIVHWIEAVYHRRRRQRRLGRLTPVEYETLMTGQAASAAYDEEPPEPSAVPPVLPFGLLERSLKSVDAQLQESIDDVEQS